MFSYFHCASLERDVSKEPFLFILERVIDDFVIKYWCISSIVAMSILSTRERTKWRTPFQELVQKYGIVFPTVIAFYLYKFKNTLQSRLLDILIQEDTNVGLRTLLAYLVNIELSVEFHSYLVSFTYFEIYVFSVLLI